MISIFIYSVSCFLMQGIQELLLPRICRAIPVPKYDIWKLESCPQHLSWHSVSLDSQFLVFKLFIKIFWCWQTWAISQFLKKADTLLYWLRFKIPDHYIYACISSYITQVNNCTVVFHYRKDSWSCDFR